MTADIYHFPGTEQDAIDHVEQSEMPSGLVESVKHIRQAQKPKSVKWDHLCPCAGMINTRLDSGKICPNCFVDEYGVHHGR